MLERRSQFLDRAIIKFVVTLAGPGEHDPDDMMKIVRPNRVQIHATPCRRQQELWLVSFVLRGDKSA